MNAVAPRKTSSPHPCGLEISQFTKKRKNIENEAIVVKVYSDSIIETLKKDFADENIKEYYWDICEKQIIEKIWNYFKYSKDGWDKLNLTQKQEAFFEEGKRSMILEDFSDIIREYLQSR